MLGQAGRGRRTDVDSVSGLMHRGPVSIQTSGDVAATSGSSALLAEPFRRGTDRIHADHSGVGLGLAIVQHIARAHAGTLTLAPRPAGGLCVTVRLPRVQGQPHTDR